MRLAFMNIGGASWAGGSSYLKNLFTALRSLEEDCRPEIFLLCSGPSSVDASLASLVSQTIQIPDSPLQLKLWRRLPDNLSPGLRSRLFFGQPLNQIFENNRIDCLFELADADLGPQIKIPQLAWIADFQHLHYPDYFPREEYTGRSRHFARGAYFSSRVILSSEAAKQDFIRFLPRHAHKVRLLHFVAHIPENIYETDPGWVCGHYHIPNKFIHLPNQFWKHKNHEIVIEALSLLKQKNPEITVICTGSTHDHRDPGYFGRLLATISARDLRDRFIILGMVPFDHLYHLMRQALAVLQPSLFEGWSTTVEETKSVGKSIILSDIPVHREQNPPQALFFEPDAPESLAECLEIVYGENKAGPDLILEASARSALPERVRQFGRTFMEIVNEAVQEKRR